MAVSRQKKLLSAGVEREERELGLDEVVWHELDLKNPRTSKASVMGVVTTW